jgi:hypothetical protein
MRSKGNDSKAVFTMFIHVMHQPNGLTAVNSPSIDIKYALIDKK